MGSLEASIVRGIRSYLAGRSDCYFVKTAPPVEAGTPDLLCCVQGRFVGVEAKQEGKHPTQLQRHRHEQIRAAGGLVIVARSVEDVKVGLLAADLNEMEWICSASQ